MPVIKFPKLPEDDVVALRKWLRAQEHSYLSRHHMYAACGNVEVAAKYKHYAGCFNYILMMETYHTEKDGD